LPTLQKKMVLEAKRRVQAKARTGVREREREGGGGANWGGMQEGESLWKREATRV
jgi:hypothetical protein